MTEMKTTYPIDNYNFAGKRVVIRVDFNVPLDASGHVTDDTRIRAAIPTIKRVLSSGGSAILMSHLGRPKGGPEAKYSLRQILPTLERLLGTPVQFASDCMDGAAAGALKPGEVLLLENLRFYAGEEKGDKEFAKKLASYGDVYINDAFGTAHRAHASTAIIADYFKPQDRLFGYVMEGELEAIDKVMRHPARPFAAIVGGSKVSTKIAILENLLDKVDSIVIGGGMTYTFEAAMGGKVGNSICEPEMFPTALDILKKAADRGVKLIFSPDTLAADAFTADARTRLVPSDDIPDGWQGLDIGDDGKELFREHLLGCKTILWNGPVGVFEMDKFASGSHAVAQAVADATTQGAFSLIGGGDTAACVAQFGLTDKMSYVSTGGGALLEYIEGKVLPGVAAIRK